MVHALSDEIYGFDYRSLELLQEYVDIVAALDIHDCWKLADLVAANLEVLQLERERAEERELEHQEWLREKEAERRFQEWKESR